MKIIFCDNTLWGLVNFRGEVIKYLKTKDMKLYLSLQKRRQTNENYHSRWCALHSNQNGAHISEPNKGHEIFSYDASYFPQRTTRLHFTYTIKPNIYGSIAARLAGCRSTAMMAGLGYIFINDSIILRAARAFYQFGLSFAEHIIVLNDYNRRLIEQKHLCAPKK